MDAALGDPAWRIGLSRSITLDHLIALSDDVGVIQHATFDVPNRSTGYCTDDVTRAFMVVLAALYRGIDTAEARRLARTYLAFLSDAQFRDGRFHNFMGYDRVWLDEVGGDDALGRGLWAAGYAVRFAPDDGWRLLCARMLALGCPHVSRFEHLRPGALTALGLAHAMAAAPDDATFAKTLDGIAATLVEAYRANRSDDWVWFEPVMTYDNARLPEALLRAGLALEREDYVRIGLRTLDFYASAVFEDDMFVPIGSDGWYPRGGPRARYPQQPLEAAAMIDAALLAAEIERPGHYGALAEAAFAWYFGRNTAGAVMVRGGGCRDGIDPQGPSDNMGAESTVAYLAAAIAMSARAAAAQIEY